MTQNRSIARLSINFNKLTIQAFPADQVPYFPDRELARQFTRAMPMTVSINEPQRWDRRIRMLLILAVPCSLWVALIAAFSLL